MSRPGRDPTLFTSTGPYASSKPLGPDRFSTIDLTANPAPPNETPQEKVARLRALAQKARRGQQSTFDSVVTTGRSIADRAHRFTTYSLIIFTGCATVFMSFSLVDLILHNRRKRKEWSVIDRQKKLDELTTAKAAVDARTATPEQVALVSAHFEHQAQEEAKRNRTWSQWIWGDKLIKEEHTGGILGAALADSEQALPMSTGTGEGLGVVRAVQENTHLLKQASSARPAVGGPLDQMAENMVRTASNEARSWTGWVRRS